MLAKDKLGSRDSRSHGKHGSGPSSFAMQDPKLVFDSLQLKTGDAFLDLGCGPGDYSIEASKIVGDSGVVYALDTWRRLIEALIEEAGSQGLHNIHAMVADITHPLPIPDRSIDVCLLATVLHTLDIAASGTALLNEIHRVMKPAGRLAIVNIKKEDTPFGPPIEIRWSPEEVEALLTHNHYKKVVSDDLGFNYMIQFVVD